MATSFQKAVIFVLCLVRFKVLTKLIMKSVLLECDTMQLVKCTNISEDPAASTVRAHLSAFMMDVAGSSEISVHLYQAMTSHPRKRQSLFFPHYMLLTHVNPLTLRRLMSYIYGAPILDVSRSHTTTQHSR